MSRAKFVWVMALCGLLRAAAAVAGWQEGVAAFQTGDYERAAGEFRRLAERHPGQPQVHFMLGRTYLELDRVPEALVELSRAWELEPDNAQYQLRLGQAYVGAGRYGDAIGFLARVDAESLSTEHQAFLAELRAVAWTRSGDRDRALDEWERAVRARPGDARLLLRYGTAAFDAGRVETAVNALRAAAELDPANADIQAGYASALLQLARTSEGRAKSSAYDRAVTAARAAVAARPDARTLMRLGEACLGARRFDEAVSIFERLAADDSSNWVALYYIGKAKSAAGELPAAESALRQALERASTTDDRRRIWGQLGSVYEKQQSFDAAIEAYRHAGDEPGASRVLENRRIDLHNRELEAAAASRSRAEAEELEIRRELRELREGGAPGEAARVEEIAEDQILVTGSRIPPEPAAQRPAADRTQEDALREELLQVLAGAPAGRIAYQPSRVMTQGVPEDVRVRISGDVEAELGGAEWGDDPLRVDAIRTTCIMKAALTARTGEFEILEKSSAEQPLDLPYTEWLWEVTPVRAGDLDLFLRVIARIRLTNGETVSRDLLVKETRIRVAASRGWQARRFWARHWQWLLGSPLVVAFVTWLAARVWKRRSAKAEV